MWARVEAESATFAPRRISPERRPPWRLLAAIAIAAIALVVGLANVGREQPAAPATAGDVDPAAAGAPVAPSMLVAVRPPPVGRVADGSPGAPIRLRTPTGRDGAITSATVPVDGGLTIYANSVQIALELDRFHRFDDIVIDTNPDGGLRQDHTPTFHVELALPTPRPIGQVWVVITAYDRAGNQIGTVRRAVLIGPATGG
jgi:hypothetical protein